MMTLTQRYYHLQHREAPAQVLDCSKLSIKPRRKADQKPYECGTARPIAITKELLTKYFHMSLKQAAKKLVRHFSNRPNADLFNCSLFTGTLRYYRKKGLQVP